MMKNQIHELLKTTGLGRMSPSAYDTAWIARLGEIATDLSDRAIEWLCDNQLPDGGWGAAAPYYYHDRLISTLAALIALSWRGRRSQDRRQLSRGVEALERIITRADRGLKADINGATIGFELIVPTLVNEAEELGIITQHKEIILDRLSHLRTIKLEKMRGLKINRSVTMAFSAEMAGIDNQRMLDVDDLQVANGSVGHSPSATAYYATYVRPGDGSAIQYLDQVVSTDGSVPDLFPFEIYEKAWVMWNVALTHPLDPETQALFDPHLDYLQKAWDPERGVGLSKGFPIPDGDNTCVTFDLLTRYNRPVDIRGLFSFKDNDHFRCYELEANSSVSVNVHALGALRSAGYDAAHPAVKIILGFLRRNRTDKGYWFDKWHISPYYTTSHAIIACVDYADSLVRPAIQWIMDTQQPSGSWGFYLPTAEETAYCIQALSILKKKGKRIRRDVLAKGVEWLRANENASRPPFWIGKGLYAGDLVVRSAIQSALLLAKGI